MSNSPAPPASGCHCGSRPVRPARLRRDQREKFHRPALPPTSQSPAGEQRPGIRARPAHADQRAGNRDRVGDRLFVEVDQRGDEHQRDQHQVRGRYRMCSTSATFGSQVARAPAAALGMPHQRRRSQSTSIQIQPGKQQAGERLRPPAAESRSRARARRSRATAPPADDRQPVGRQPPRRAGGRSRPGADRPLADRPADRRPG